MDGAGNLRLCVLGELTGSLGDAAIELGGRRQRAVLAALVIARGEAVSADRLADCVWGDNTPANPSGALQSYVSHLRRHLEPHAAARARHGVIAKMGPGYALRLGLDAVDAWRFERAVTAASTLPPADAVARLDGALRLWRGPAYADYGGEEWAQAEITRLTELRAVARERLLGAHLDLGEAALLVSELESLLADEPLREERWRLLGLALYRSQRQADALASLRRARETLAEMLGVDPGPELRALEREVLAQSPTLDAPARTTLAAPTGQHHLEVGGGAQAEGGSPDRMGGTPEALSGTGPEVADVAVTRTDLVDREHEGTVLARAVVAVAAGTGGFVLIEGPAGIGKTRLLLEAVRLGNAAGLRVVSARCSQLERTFGFGTVRQLFEPSVVDPARRVVALDGPAVSATGVFEPVAGDQRADGTFAVLHGLYWLTINLTAAGPLLLTIDDVQWCDPALLRLLDYLVRRLEAVPVLVIVAMRTGEARAVAILGSGSDLLAVADLAALSESDAAAALDALVRSDIVSLEGPAFVHPLVRDAVYDGLPLGERQLFHERAAAILQGKGAASEEIAAHLLRAPHRGTASTVATLRDAARTALRRGGVGQRGGAAAPRRRGAVSRTRTRRAPGRTGTRGDARRRTGRRRPPR